MNTLPNSPKYFKARHFEHEIILLCVRWYETYKSSYRDLVEMMAVLGIKLAHQIRKEKRKRRLKKQGKSASENPWMRLLAA